MYYVIYEDSNKRYVSQSSFNSEEEAQKWINKATAYDKQRKNPPNYQYTIVKSVK